jgi:hypothetical protein
MRFGTARLVNEDGATMHLPLRSRTNRQFVTAAAQAKRRANDHHCDQAALVAAVRTEKSLNVLPGIGPSIT